VVEGKRPDKKHESAAELLGDWRLQGGTRLPPGPRQPSRHWRWRPLRPPRRPRLRLSRPLAPQWTRQPGPRARRSTPRMRLLMHSEAAQIASTTAEEDKARADQAVSKAEQAEDAARDRASQGDSRRSLAILIVGRCLQVGSAGWLGTLPIGPRGSCGGNRSSMSRHTRGRDRRGFGGPTWIWLGRPQPQPRPHCAPGCSGVRLRLAAGAAHGQDGGSTNGAARR
jgi:hypothetical protein